MVAEDAPPSGILFVLSAPSGTGKSTLAHSLVESIRRLEFSVSYTTRPRRESEEDGQDYHFVTREQFEKLRAAGAFLECADVFGQLYGTALERTRQVLAQGRDLLLDIDVQGAGQVRRSAIPAVTIMLLPPDFQTLERRLRGRGSESQQELADRLAQAGREAVEFDKFDYVVVNDALGETLLELQSIVRAERRRTSRCLGQIRRIVRSFPGQASGAR